MGLLRIAHEPFDLAPIVRNVAHDAELLAREHQFVVEGTDQSALVRGDPLRVEQALRNLVGNAVKYSPDGGRVALTIVHEPDSVVVRVADQGIGIPPAEIPHLFKRFYRVDGGRARSISGSGIGLYVVHQIVMLHGGMLSVESVEGAGSTFTMTLPVYVPERQSSETGA
jgi:signal transduction histidine kinase